MEPTAWLADAAHRQAASTAMQLDLLPVFEGHGVAEIVGVIGGAATVEADVLGIHHEPFDLFELFLTHKDAQVSGMVVR